MTRVLVSGGTGYAGRFIVEHLLANGYKITVGGRSAPEPDFFSKPVAFVPLTLDPEKDQIEAFDSVYYFVHAAFHHVTGRYRGGEGDDPAGFRTANLDGSVRLFENARDAGVRRCVFLSSRAAYPTLPAGTPLVETQPGYPDTLYGEVKLQAERSLSSLCGHGFLTTSLRATGIYGDAAPGRPHKWSSLFQDYLAGKSVAPRAGTEVHGQDVANAVSLILNADAVRINGETVNVSDILTDRHEILSIVKAITDCPYPLPEPSERLSINAMDTTKLQSLGWTGGGHDLLRRTVEELVKKQMTAASQFAHRP